MLFYRCSGFLHFSKEDAYRIRCYGRKGIRRKITGKVEYDMKVRNSRQAVTFRLNLMNEKERKIYEHLVLVLLDSQWG